MDAKQKLVLIILFLVALAGLAWWLSLDRPRANDEGMVDSHGEESEKTWTTYENSAFGFAIDYPADWEVAEFPEDAIAPMFNFYPRGQEVSFPITHFSSIAHVSVYPEGIPTEGIFGESRDSTLIFQVLVKNVRDFVLEDGTPWATFVGIADAPSKWNEAGFLFARVAVEDLQTKCLRDGAEVPQEQCDPLFDDTIVRSGHVDERVRVIEERMLESFRFTDAAREVGLRLEEPQPNARIESPLVVRGEAVGPWYFEASFPVRLLDGNGNELSIAPAEAKDDWMTTEFVPFSATLTFETPSTESGVLVLEKSNASGLSEYAGEIRIPVRFR